MGLDPLLYVALGVGFLLGRIPHPRSAWVPRATIGTVAALIFFLGDGLGEIAGFDPVVDVLPSLVFALVLAGFTLAAAYALRRRTPPPKGDPVPIQGPPPMSLVFVIVLVVGFAVGRSVGLPSTPWLDLSLYLLLALVAFDLDLTAVALPRVWVPLVAAVVGALAAALAVAAIGRVTPTAAFATALGFGWYTLTGPLVSARFGASLGLLAFLTNFLREQLTILLSPYLGRVVGAEGIVALGGATSMDTTLYFAVRHGTPPGHPDNGTLALASGLILTVAASVVVPAVLGLG